MNNLALSSSLPRRRTIALSADLTLSLQSLSLLSIPLLLAAAINLIS